MLFFFLIGCVKFHKLYIYNYNFILWRGRVNRRPAGEWACSTCTPAQSPTHARRPIGSLSVIIDSNFGSLPLGLKPEAKRMKNIFGMRAVSAILAVLLVSVALVPVVSAQNVEKTFSTIQIEEISVSENEREYIVYGDEAKTEAKFFVREKKINVDQKEVWQAKIFEMYPDGTVSADASFGKDSYYWSDDEGVHIHIGPVDMSYILSAGAAGSGVVGAWLAVALGLGGPIGVAFAAVLIGLLLVSAYLYTNPDNSLDVYLSYLTIGLIPVYVAMPGAQPIVVQLGTNDVVLFL